MPAPVTIRYAAFTVFSICCLVLLGLAGANLSQTKVIGSLSPIARVDAFVLFNAVVGLLAVFVVVPFERLRPFPTTSKLFIEVAWISLFCVLNLAAATAATIIGVRDVCSPSFQDILPRAACGSVGGLQVFSWLATVTLLFYALFISSCARLNSERIPKIWQMTVLEVEWVANGKETAVLPTYREKQVPVYTIGPKPLLTVHKSTLSLTIPAEKSLPQTLAPQRPADLIHTPASNKATPALYPHFFTTTQARPVSQDSIPLDTSSTHSASDATSVKSGRSSPSSTRSSSVSSPLSSPSSAGSKPVASDASSGLRSGSSSQASSPRIKHRPPPLNLAGLSAFDAATKSKKRQDRN